MDPGAVQQCGFGRRAPGGNDVVAEDQGRKDAVGRRQMLRRIGRDAHAGIDQPVTQPRQGTAAIHQLAARDHLPCDGAAGVLCNTFEQVG